MQDAEIYRVAIHEAAHAVIGRVLTLTCGGATTIPNEAEGEAGFHMVAGPDRIQWDWEQRGKFRNPCSAYRGRILCYMAGAEAERVILGGCPGGDDDDRAQIQLMAASRYCFDDYAAWLRAEPRMRKWTTVLVRRHRARIELVAMSLIDRGALEAEEIDACFLPR